MKVVLAQINPKLGDVSLNTSLILNSLQQAISLGAELVVFPELCLTGYPPRDLLDFPTLVDSNLKALEEIAAQVPNHVSAIVGYIDINTAAFGKPYRNAAALLSDRKIQSRYFKRLLPSYDVFEDERYFERGTELGVWTVNGKRVGITICEDAWNEPSYLNRLYDINPFSELAEKKCDLVVNISASPFYLGKPTVRAGLFRKIAMKCKTPVVFCNQVGAHDDLIFDGSSFVMGADGEVISEELPFISSLLFTDLSTKKSPPVVPPDKSRQWTEVDWVREALQLGIQDYCAKSGVQKVILGLSGGVDSSVVACLAAGALGADKVVGISLPSRHTSQASKDDARIMAKRLGIEFHEIAVDAAYASYQNMLAPFLAGHSDTLLDENLQPRIRMTLLMALSQKMGALLLNTSNKSEIACGYATLYGDTAGALAVLGDLTKRRVYALAQQFEGPLGPIPERVLTRPPSAELRPDQKDEDSLPPYSLLDTLVTEAVEGGKDRAQLLNAHPEAKPYVNRFGDLYRGSEFKRFQSPPILRLTARSFGRGRRIPLASTKLF